mgnify:FL=1
MTADLNQANKRLVWNHWKALESVAEEDLHQVMLDTIGDGLLFHGPDPINDLHGAEAFLNGYWRPLRHSFSGLKRRSHMFFGGASNARADGLDDGRLWVCGTGHFDGVFDRDWLGIPANGQPVHIRWGECSEVVDGRIVETYVLLDLVDLLQQVGIQVLPPGRGADGVWPPPRNDDAILLEAQDENKSRATLDLIRRFIFDSLNVYDQEDLESMGVADYFHPRVEWYGPGGIGHASGLKAFEDLHQKHWLHAFPDRAVQDLDNLFAEGDYTCGTGWAGVHATHKGQYLDCPATGKRIVVNGLDYWRRQGNQFIENWVFVDMVHLFRQFGVDLLARAGSGSE